MEEDLNGRQNWFLFQRTYPFASIPDDARRKAWESRPILKRAQIEDVLSWQPIGPVSISSNHVSTWGTTSGRISAIAVHPNGQIILIGSPTGGIWRSTDGGVNFVPVSDNLADLSVGSISFAKSNPQIVYAGTGDQFNNAYFGNGLLKSTDAGQTWVRISDTSLPSPGFIKKVETDPSDPNRVYVAEYAYLDPSTNVRISAGFFISTDGGVSWTRTLAGLPRGFAIHPTQPQTIYLAMRRVDPAAANKPPGVYKSVDGGATWTNIYTSPYDAQLTKDIRVAVTAADPQRVYLFEGGTIGGVFDLRVEVSADGGGTWTSRGARTDIDPGQFNYNTYLYADPANANNVYIGSRDTFKSTDGGLSFTNIIKNYAAAPWKTYSPGNATTHSDQQTLAFSPADSNVIYLGNDGGIFKSPDGGTSVQSLNNTLSISQFVGYALDPNDSSRSYGGTQDNGSQKRVASSSQWKEIDSGDGGNDVIDAVDPSIVFTTYIYGSITRLTSFGDNYDTVVGSNTTFGESVNSPRINFYPPFIGNGVNSKLYFGTWRLYISPDRGNSWSPPGGTTDLTTGSGDVLSAIGVARSNPSVIYTGSAGGRAMVTSNEGVAWTDITTGLPTRSITSIVVSSTDPATAYLTVSGFATGHIFKTTNTGATWTDISGNLPNIPTNALLVDPTTPSTLYAGTDIGVFRSTVGGTTWDTFNAGLPPVSVSKLVTSNGKIQVATYGRGAYELASITPASVKFSSASFSAKKGDDSASITVTRTGDTSVASAVDYATSDGTANQIKDYIASYGTLNFSAGEVSKPFPVLLIKNLFVEGDRTINLTLSNASGATLDALNTAVLTVTETNTTTPTTNPLDNADALFFVREHYYDFLGRLPDPAGFAYWTGQITVCGTDQACINKKRLDVSNAFFFELEYQQTAAYVLRLYRAAFGNTQPFPNTDPSNPTEAKKIPAYSAFAPDRARVIGGAGLGQSQLALANAFVMRPSFLTKYPASLTGALFVDTLIASINSDSGADLTSQRDLLVTLFNQGGRGAVIYRIADDNVQTNPINNRAFVDAEYNRSFVTSQYFGYLRRDSDIAGLLFWLGQVNRFPIRDTGIQHAMVCSFITSDEYQLRFSTVKTHSNGECPQ